MPSLPSQPGVYWFSDADDNVLYVGKAKNLKNRVSSYTRVTQLRSRIKQLSQVATSLKFKVLDSELEALLTEAELIRTYQPQYNIALKDDKSPLYILITDELYPRVLQTRKKEILTRDTKATILGPFPSAYKVVEVLKIVRPIFPWCNKTGDDDPRLHPQSNRPCFYRHLDMCPGACTGNISPEKYAETITQLVAFLKGAKKHVLTQLQQDLEATVQTEAFEEAAQLRDRISLIKNVTSQKKRLKPTLTTPGLTQHGPTDSLMYLRRILVDYCQLPKDYPLERIEGYDVSNTQGSNASVAMVVFEHGLPANNQYRLFNIRSLETPNDYQMIKEALLRRQNHREWGWPNLVLVDGGRGQVRAAISVWQDTTPVIGLVKNPDRIVIPSYSLRSKVGIVSQQQKDLTKNKDVLQDRNYHIIKLEPTHPALKLLQRIRDESHRFSKKQHARRRTKAMFS